jgi:xylulokinase
MLPYFAGERTPIHDPHARGVIAGLTLRHGPGDLLRAAYEATAFAARQIIALLGEADAAPQRVVTVGGGTDSELWMQIVSDVTGLTQQVPAETIGASYGAALLAAIGAGLLGPDTDWARPVRDVTPDARSSASYDALFELYGDLYRCTSGIVHALSGRALDLEVASA